MVCVRRPWKAQGSFGLELELESLCMLRGAMFVPDARRDIYFTYTHRVKVQVAPGAHQGLVCVCEPTSTGLRFNLTVLVGHLERAPASLSPSYRTLQGQRTSAHHNGFFGPNDESKATDYRSSSGLQLRLGFRV